MGMRIIAPPSLVSPIPQENLLVEVAFTGHQPPLFPKDNTGMSTASRLTLLATIVSTVGVVSFVHWAQTAEKAVITLSLPKSTHLRGLT